MNQRYCLTQDLKDDPQLIAEYKRYHQKIWPEITASLKESGVEDAEIYLMGTRMVMILEVNDYFSFEAKARADQKNPKVQEWEELMWKLSNRCRGEARREMALDGEDFQAGKLTTLPFHISSKVAPLLGGSRGPNFPKWNSPTRRPHFF